MNSAKLKQIRNLCRVCLESIPENEATDLQNSLLSPEVYELFSSFTTVDVQQDAEGFPKQLCPQCLSKLKACKDFRDETLQSTKRLHVMINDQEDMEDVVVKSEPCIEECEENGAAIDAALVTDVYNGGSEDYDYDENENENDDSVDSEDDRSTEENCEQNDNANISSETMVIKAEAAYDSYEESIVENDTAFTPIKVEEAYFNNDDDNRLVSFFASAVKRQKKLNNLQVMERFIIISNVLRWQLLAELLSLRYNPIQITGCGGYNVFYNIKNICKSNFPNQAST